MKVLLIGQLPKEIGGSYTTGVANVVYELSQHTVEGLKYYTYGTNIKNKYAKNNSKFVNQFLGYRIRPLHIIYGLLIHPFHRIKEWNHYRKIYHVNPLHFEIYRDNFVRCIKLVKPDVINIHGTGIAPLKYANQNFNIPIVQTFHGVSDADDEEARRVRPQNFDSAKLADYVTVLTQSIKQFAIEVLQVNPNEVAVIPNGCDTRKFYYDINEREIIRQLMGINKNDTIFITASSVIRRKGQMDFIKVMEKLPDGFQYWIIGKGPDFDNCVNYCKEHHLEEKVRFLGYIPNQELYKYYSAADIFVHASYREAQALCEIEAYACGMKIVLNNAIVHTVATDTTDKEIYYIIDFNNTDLLSFVSWATDKPSRKSRMDKDWANVVNEYKNYFENILR